MNSPTSLLRSSSLLLGLALAAQSASAAFMPTFVNITPSGSNFSFNYTLNFSTTAPAGVAPRLDAGGFVTIYDIPGLVTATPGAGFTLTTQMVGTTAPLTVPADDPALPNLTFTYTGPSITADTSFSGFSIISTFGFSGSDNYTSIFRNVSNSTNSSEVGFVLVPSASPTGGPGGNVPDGGSSAVLLGSALIGLAALRRKLLS